METGKQRKISQMEDGMDEKESSKAQYIMSSIEGNVLTFLVIFYLLLFIFPGIPAAVFNRAGFLSDKFESRSVFILMPLVLSAEFMWFSGVSSDGTRNSLLTTFALLVTAAIPFLNIFK